MAQFSPAENLTLEDQIRALANEELLDFWEEAQLLARVLGTEKNEQIQPNPEYERLILQELQFRSCMKSL